MKLGGDFLYPIYNFLNVKFFRFVWHVGDVEIFSKRLNVQSKHQCTKNFVVKKEY